MIKVLSWTKNYTTDKFKGDLSAGITTGIMLIPQGMAYALIAGLPPIYGLYAALIPPVVYSIFGSSYQLSVGPVATASILIFAGLTQLNLSAEQFILAASVLAFLVGLIQFIFGLSRLGFIVNFLSRPVITGYTSAAALIIGVSQLKNLLGIEGKSSSHFIYVLREIFDTSNDISLNSLLFGAIAMAMLILLRKINRKLPGPIIAVILGIVGVHIFDLSSQLKILKDIPSGLPDFQPLHFTFEEFREILPLALIISLVSFLESISISKTLQLRSNEYQVKANNELIALGLANMTGSLFRSFPVSGGFARSAVHQQAGARTPLALMISSLLIGITLLFLTPVFYYLPKSILAAIIIVAVMQLINFREAKNLWSISKRDFWMMIATFIATLLIGIQEGIITGVLLSLVMVIFKSTYPHTAVLGKLPDTNYYRNLNRFPEAFDRRDIIIFRFDAQLYFANIQFFVDTLCELINKKGKVLKVIVINSQAINGLDMSAVHGLKEFIKDIQSRGLNIYFTEVIGPVRDVMKKTGIYELLGKDHFHMRVQDAIDHFDSHSQNEDKYAIQSNE